MRLASRARPRAPGVGVATLIALFDEHYGDVVPDRVAAAALSAGELPAFELDRRLAGGARQNVQQVLTDRHCALLVRLASLTRAYNRVLFRKGSLFDEGLPRRPDPQRRIVLARGG